MKIETFDLERYQSTWEYHVDVNLSESGVHPLTVRELLELGGDVDALLDERLVYTQTNGTEELRGQVAALHAGATHANVEITNGGSEANFVVTWNLVGDDDEVIMMVPNYMQTCGLARCFGGRVHEWALVADGAAGRWRPDLDALRGLVNERTRLIAICNPDNPTGARLTGSELDEIAAIAESCGAWILSDEIYRGAELDGVETDSMWGRTERALVTGGLSKAYGLPGLRVGWVVGPEEKVDTLWSYHDYTTIGPGAISDHLARHALAQRDALLSRGRAILRENLDVALDWVRANDDVVHAIAPEAGAMLYVAYRPDIPSMELAERLRTRTSTLIVPGEHYGMENHLRVGYGGEREKLEAGLERLANVLRGSV